MPTITLKNIPPDLYKHLRQAAEVNHRSLNSEIIVCIERTLHSRRIAPDAVLTRARLLRSRTAKRPVSDRAFAAAKKIGRL